MEYKKGDIVLFKEEYRAEKDNMKYVLILDPDGGRVKVSPLETGLEFPPIEVVKTE